MAEYALAVDEAALRRFLLVAEEARQAERHQWAEAGIVNGAAIADAGCGPGAITVHLARAVGPDGAVTAIDQGSDALAMARQLTDSAGLKNMTFRTADVESTGLSPNSIDAIMLRNVLGHNGGREQVIVDHLASCIRPRGCLYIVDVDLTGLRVYPDDAELRRINDSYIVFQRARSNDVSA